MSPTRISRLESAIRVTLEFHEAFNRHDLAGMIQLTSEDCVFENSAPAPGGAVYSGRNAITRFLSDFFRKSPHTHIEIEEVFGLGNRCILRWRCDWKDGEGEKRQARGVDIYKVENGSIREKLSYAQGW